MTRMGLFVIGMVAALGLQACSGEPDAPQAAREVRALDGYGKHEAGRIEEAIEAYAAEMAATDDAELKGRLTYYTAIARADLRLSELPDTSAGAVRLRDEIAAILPLIPEGETRDRAEYRMLLAGNLADQPEAGAMVALALRLEASFDEIAADMRFTLLSHAHDAYHGIGDYAQAEAVHQMLEELDHTNEE